MAATAARSPRTSTASADVTAAMATVAISSPDQTTAASPTTGRSTSVRLSVPLDAKPTVMDAAAAPRTASSSTTYPVRKLARRDSMERREALLKGKEGSRQRRRWENGE